jgi:hypothetical protein
MYAVKRKEEVKKMGTRIEQSFMIYAVISEQS